MTSYNYQKSGPEVISTQINNRIPNHLISQLHKVEPHDYHVEAANQSVRERECQFGSEKTNLEQFFKANPDLFLDTDQYSTHKPYVPYSHEWEDKSDCYNNIISYQDESAPSHYIVNRI